MLILPSVLTHLEARDVLRVFRETALRGEPGALVVDGSGLQRFDSSALAVLLACRRLADELGRPFAVQQLPPKLGELARLYGVDSLLPAASA